MADCTRGEIPDEIIKDKGLFHCKNFFKPPYQQSFACPGSTGVEYVPAETDIIVDSDQHFNPETFRCLSSEALSDALGTTMLLKNVVYDDAYMSWESDVITVRDSEPQPSIEKRFYPPTCNCCGEKVIFITTTDAETGCYRPPFGIKNKLCGCGPSSFEANPFANTVINSGWFGTVLQFYFNIYKVYCCVKNENDEVIDYDYSYWYVEMHKRDGVTCIDSYGQILCSSFCTPSTTNSINPPVEVPFAVFTGSYLLDRYFVKLKVKEENDL